MVTIASLKGKDLQPVVEQMVDGAGNMGILGAAVIGIYRIELDARTNEAYLVSGLASAEEASKLSRRPQPEKRGRADIGTDYLAMAHAKKSRRLRIELKQDIAGPLVRRGEDKARGDEAVWLASNIIAVAAFSGAATEQDRQIAEFGIATLLLTTINPDDFDGYTKWFQDHPKQQVNLK